MGTELKKDAAKTDADSVDAEMLEHLDLLLEYEAVKDDEQLAIAEELPEEVLEEVPAEEEKQ
jgi:hypothetical protein